MVLIICQDFLILYGTVDKWQHNKSPFLLLSRMWANFFLKHYHFPPSSAWHKSLKANVMEKEQQILSRITHIIVYDMWVYVWRMWAYYLEQIPPRETKLSFIPMRQSSMESLTLQQPYFCDICICHLWKSVSAAPCLLGCAIRFQEIREQSY